MILKPNTPPLKFQSKGVAILEKELDGLGILADEMGLGKTYQAYLYAWINKADRPVVVICPAYLKFNWQREARQHFNARAEILNGRKPSRGGLLRDAKLIIVNYDILKNWLPFLKRLKPKLIIIDEPQYICSRTAQRTIATVELCKGITKKIALSGTPLLNAPAELWQLLNILWPEKFPSFFSFAMRYCEPKRRPWGWEYKGAKNLDKLHRKLKRLGFIRRLFSEVFKDFPKQRRVIVPLGIDNRKEYDSAVNDFVSWLSKRTKSRVRLKKAHRAMRLVKFGYMKRLCGELKLNPVYDWLVGYLANTDTKIIVFCVHRKIIKAICDRFPTTSLRVDGSVTGRKRQSRFDQFNHDPKKRMMVTNIGTGWNGQVAPVVAHVEFPWTPGELLQKERRVLRIGQKRPTIAYYLVGMDTIEEDLCAMLQKKQRVLSAVLDGDEGVNELDIFSQLEKKLRKANGKSRVRKA